MSARGFLKILRNEKIQMNPRSNDTVRHSEHRNTDHHSMKIDPYCHSIWSSSNVSIYTGSDIVTVRIYFNEVTVRISMLTITTVSLNLRWYSIAIWQSSLNVPSMIQ